MHLHTFANIRAIGQEVGTSLGWPRILRRFRRLLKKLSRLNLLPRNHLNPSSLEGFFVRRYNYTWRYPIQRKKSVHLYPRHPPAHVASSTATQRYFLCWPRTGRFSRRSRESKAQACPPAPPSHSQALRTISLIIGSPKQCCNVPP